MRLAGTIALAVALFGCSERPKLERLAPAERNVRDMVKLAQSRGVAVLRIGTPEPGFTVSPPAFYAGSPDSTACPMKEPSSAKC
ncbi:MAG TPA: hypothetical protein VFX94_07975 [Burkholderiales bacterium]|nr:hypothetical protein [Burkholderiales bacterium]